MSWNPRGRLAALEARQARATPAVPEPLEVTVTRRILKPGPDGPEQVGERVREARWRAAAPTRARNEKPASGESLR